MRASSILRAVLWLVMLAGLMALVLIPVTVARAPEAFPGVMWLDRPVVLTLLGATIRVYPKGLMILYGMGLLGLWICGELLRMLNTIKTDPFVARNAAALARIGRVAMAVTALAFWAGYRWRDGLMSLVGCAMLILGLFAMTLSRLFRQAVSFKEENDLTI